MVRRGAPANNHVSGDILTNNTFAGTINKFYDTFQINYAGDSKKRLTLSDAEQSVGKKLRVDDADNDDDGIYLSTGGVDLFKVFRGSGNTTLRMAKPDGAGSSVEIDLSAGTANFSGLTLTADAIEAASFTASTGTPTFDAIKVSGQTNYKNASGSTVTTGYVLGDACTRGVSSADTTTWNGGHTLVTSDQVYDNCEFATNKATSIDTTSEGNYTSQVKYPTVKAVYDHVAANAGSSSGFDVDDTNPGIILSSIPDTQTTNVTVGNVSSGTTAATLKAKSLATFMSDMFFTESFPVANNQTPLVSGVQSGTNKLVGSAIPDDAVSARSGRYFSSWLSGNARYHPTYGAPTAWTMTLTNHSNSPITTTTVSSTTEGYDNTWTGGTSPNYTYTKTIELDSVAALLTTEIGTVDIDFSVTLDANPTPTNLDGTALASSYGNAYSGSATTAKTFNDDNNRIYIVAPVYLGYQTRNTSGVFTYTDLSNTGTSHNWSSTSTKYDCGEFDETGAIYVSGAYNTAYKFQTFDFPTDSISGSVSAYLYSTVFSAFATDHSSEYFQESITRTINNVTVNYTRFTYWGENVPADATACQTAIPSASRGGETIYLTP
jgi:hypothetical protein